MKAKAGLAFVTALLLLFMAVAAHRGVLLLGSEGPVAKGLGVAVLVVPAVAAWAIVSEFVFGFRSDRLAKILDREGGLPVDDLPRTPAGRIVREAADEKFVQFRQEVDADPGSWRAWFRLSLGYDMAGDRRRARAAMRTAIDLERGRGSGD